MNFVAELFTYLFKKKKLSLLPIFIVLLLFGGLVILSEYSLISPFIYTLF